MAITASSRSVLIIDDDPVLVALVAAWLTALGYMSAPAATSAEALRVLRSGHRFEVLLTDLHIGHEDGAALLHELLPSLPKDCLRILMSSSLPVHSEPSPFHVMLEKPFTREDLASALECRPVSIQPALSVPPPEINPQVYEQLTRTLSHSTLRELYVLTFAEARRSLAQIETHFALAQFDQVRRHAHALRGSCAMAALSQLAALAKSVEENPSAPFMAENFMTCIKTTERNLAIRLGLSQQSD